MKRNNMKSCERIFRQFTLIWVLVTTITVSFCPISCYVVFPMVISTSAASSVNEEDQDTGRGTGGLRVFSSHNNAPQNEFLADTSDISQGSKLYEKLAVTSLELETGTRLKGLMNVLDTTDSIALSIWNAYTKQSSLVKFVAGTYLIFYGGSFVHLMLFIHAISINSESLNESFNNLFQSYKESRNNLKKSIPELMRDIEKEKRSLTSLKTSIQIHQKKLKESVTAFENAQITKEQFSRKAEKEMKEIELLSNKLKQVYVSQRTFAHIKEIIDPSHFKQALQSIYHTLLLGVGALRSHTIATLAMGLNMGKMVYDRLEALLPDYHIFAKTRTNSKSNPNLIDDDVLFMKNIDLYLHDGVSVGYSTFNPSSDSPSKWVKQSMKWTLQIVGISIAFVTRHFVNLLSAVSFGSHLILNSAETTMKKIVATVPDGDFKRTALRIPKPVVVTTFQAFLIYIGLRIQLPAFFQDKTVRPITQWILALLKIDTEGAVRHMPKWLSFLSSPLFFLEKLLAKKSKRDIFNLN